MRYNCKKCGQVININSSDLVRTSGKKVKETIVVNCQHCNTPNILNIINGQVRSASLPDAYEQGRIVEKEKIVKEVIERKLTEEELISELTKNYPIINENAPLMSFKDLKGKEPPYLKRIENKIIKEVEMIKITLEDKLSKETDFHKKIDLGFKLINPFQELKNNPVTANLIYELELNSKSYLISQIEILKELIKGVNDNIDLNKLNISDISNKKELIEETVWISGIVYSSKRKELLKEAFNKGDLTIIDLTIPAKFLRAFNESQTFEELLNKWTQMLEANYQTLGVNNESVDTIKADLDRMIDENKKEIQESEIELINYKKMKELQEELNQLEANLEALEQEGYNYKLLVKTRSYEIIGYNNNKLMLLFKKEPTLETIMKASYTLRKELSKAEDDNIKVIIEADNNISNFIKEYITQKNEFFKERYEAITSLVTAYFQNKDKKSYKDFKKTFSEVVNKLSSDEKKYLKKMIEMPTKKKKKIKGIKYARFGLESLLAGMIGLPTHGIISKYINAKESAAEQASSINAGIEAINQREEQYSESMDNGDVRQVTDLIDTYEKVFLNNGEQGFGPAGIDEERMFSDPTYGLYVYNQQVDEAELGFDINGDGELSVTDNPFYIDSGNWTESQKRGIEMITRHYQDLSQLSSLEQALTSNQYQGDFWHNLLRLNDSSMNEVTRMTTIAELAVGAAAIIGIAEAVRGVKKLIEKRKYGPSGRIKFEDEANAISKKITFY